MTEKPSSGPGNQRGFTGSSMKISCRSGREDVVLDIRTCGFRASTPDRTGPGLE
jgi:hypothetical protein